MTTSPLTRWLTLSLTLVSMLAGCLLSEEVPADTEVPSCEPCPITNGCDWSVGICKVSCEDNDECRGGTHCEDARCIF
ncbi:MAG: hypothetical protein H0V89_11100 [Deltaproteobacteria bacterium]|nr:hypothetical protein [Deltaproteobacteria bacterium]